ncbi:hypothetical protein COU59_02080 [Candidatus Pacearchaeota archaeon CG10_big_fil_rev_8_21_14_0_10_34_12]|nr:MAG: hypothetical protein COU59_02080 [Candidatus Pacearchaeota archaeon CG10_big_fil_rev_8_21_14_0_10_34_12]
MGEYTTKLRYPQPHNFPEDIRNRINNSALEQRMKEHSHAMANHPARCRAAGLTREYDNIRGTHNTFTPKHHPPRE